jgi:hypothetical protein
MQYQFILAFDELVLYKAVSENVEFGEKIRLQPIIFPILIFGEAVLMTTIFWLFQLVLDGYVAYTSRLY